MDLQLAAVTRPCVDLADCQRAAQRAEDLLLQASYDHHLFGGRGRGLGLDAGRGDLAENVQHEVGSAR